MTADKNNLPVDKESEELAQLVKKADHLSNFGTLTSLVSTAFYFIEQALSKRLPKWLNNLSLASVGVGIAAVFASFYYRAKAGKIALYSSAHISDEHIRNEIGAPDPKSATALQESPALNDGTATKQKWAEQAANEQQASSPEPRR